MRGWIMLFINKFKIVLSLLKVDFFKSILVTLTYSKQKKMQNIVKFHKKSIVKFEKGAIIDNNGTLQFNISRFKNNRKYGYLFLSKNSKLIIRDNFSINRGADIFLGEYAELELGSGYIMDNVQIQCLEKIKIGNDVVISRDVIIRDSDSHDILDGKHIQTKEIEIGNHVWIGLRAVILKGVKVGDGSIIAAGALVNKDVPPKCLVGGVPAKILNYNVEWK
jgi:acetyltransferase-like isoleucine patch superfamily enzyme